MVPTNEKLRLNNENLTPFLNNEILLPSGTVNNLIPDQ